MEVSREYEPKTRLERNNSTILAVWPTAKSCMMVSAGALTSIARNSETVELSADIVVVSSRGELAAKSSRATTHCKCQRLYDPEVSESCPKSELGSLSLAMAGCGLSHQNPLSSILQPRLTSCPAAEHTAMRVALALYVPDRTRHSFNEDA